MRAQLKKIITTNVVLYYLWFILVRKRKGLDVDFFHRDTDVYIDGYARSGNTFIIHLVRKLFPGINTIHHLHVVAPIKIAFLLDIPAFILLRNPLDCISSKYLKHFAMRGLEVEKTVDDRLLNEFILDYLTYYKFISKNQDKLSIINFDKLINSPKVIVDKIQDKLEIEKKYLQKNFRMLFIHTKGLQIQWGVLVPIPKRRSINLLSRNKF